MAVAGIICEYNPFHNGHRKQFRQIRQHLGEDTAIICLMSGDYVQRGQPALYPKEVRAEAAVRCGADLVLELPVNCVLRSAEGFASGGVSIFGKLGCCDYLAFGCEDADAVSAAVEIRSSARFEASLHEAIAEGLSYAAACERAFRACGCDGTVFSKPNNILAMEYCRALAKEKLDIRPLLLPREGSYHAREEASADCENPSAEYIRSHNCMEEMVPPEAFRCYAGQPEHRMEYGDLAVISRLRLLTAESASVLPYSSEGLWNRIRAEAAAARSVDRLILSAKSRRYPYTRLSRMVLCAALGVTEALLQQEPPYVRVLGFDEKGRKLLREIKTRGSVNILHAGEREPDSAFAELDHRCDLLYDLFTRPDAGDVPETGMNRGKRVFYFKNTAEN